MDKLLLIGTISISVLIVEAIVCLDGGLSLFGKSQGLKDCIEDFSKVVTLGDLDKFLTSRKIGNGCGYMDKSDVNKCLDLSIGTYGNATDVLWRFHNLISAAAEGRVCKVSIWDDMLHDQFSKSKVLRPKWEYFLRLIFAKCQNSLLYKLKFIEEHSSNLVQAMRIVLKFGQIFNWSSRHNILYETPRPLVDTSAMNLTDLNNVVQTSAELIDTIRLYGVIGLESMKIIRRDITISIHQYNSLIELLSSCYYVIEGTDSFRRVVQLLKYGVTDNNGLLKQFEMHPHSKVWLAASQSCKLLYYLDIYLIRIGEDGVNIRLKPVFAKDDNLKWKELHLYQSLDIIVWAETYLNPQLKAGNSSLMTKYDWDQFHIMEHKLDRFTEFEKGIDNIQFVDRINYVRDGRKNMRKTIWSEKFVSTIAEYLQAKWPMDIS